MNLTLPPPLITERGLGFLTVFLASQGLGVLFEQIFKIWFFTKKIGGSVIGTFWGASG